ncbi:apolipoprotein B-100 isoform X2 [Trichosurus vulpecula]|uniref:apolipoprotein B-100 isoform X2 n=1 Tax=Trichosurus vulpecula TaxID=9337 RepID=UPI00186B4A6E|nr:apolipoprotein B-100 isoform X2 [Trichosurus vulpecula]
MDLGAPRRPRPWRATMGTWGTLLLLLLLLGGSSSQEEGKENQSPTCPKDTIRFKHLRKYVYSYEAESANNVAGTADSYSATKINCKVELEVPQLCRFILKMSQCTLKEVYGFDPDGKALLRKTKNSDEFAAALSRYDLRLSIPDGKQVLLYPEKEEPAHILNMKRGVVSALLVPMDTEEGKRVLAMETVYGNCSSDVTVRAKKDVGTEILLDRNLEKCDRFKPISKAASPIALIKGLGGPLSKLLSSRQECAYTLDPRRKHVAEAVCREQHLFLPFSYKNQYGMMARITQTLKLEDTPKINSRFFDADAFQKRSLALENVEATAPAKEGGEVVLKTLQELRKLSTSEQNEHQAKLFSRLVTSLRALNEETITSLWPKLLEVSSPLALQALVQCGQPQCYSHILHWLKTEKTNPLLIDAASYIMALIPNPSAQRLREIFKVAQERPSRITLYALSHVVNKFHQKTSMVSQELKEVADYLTSRLGNECVGSEEATYLTLRVIGNMGRTLEEVSPQLKASLLKCIQSPAPSLSVQKAAIQALRKMELTEEVQNVLLQTFLDGTAPEEKRLAAYLLLMRQPTLHMIRHVIIDLQTETSEQVRSFVASHLANVLVSEEPSVQDLRSQVKEALQGSQLPAAMDFRRFSQNYQFSKTFSIPIFGPFSSKVEGNLMFDPHNYLPKETMLKTTLSVFGFHPTDLFEVGLEGKGYEPTLEALFGKQGFFPDSATKALYWVDGRVPDPVSKVLVDHFGYTKEEKRDQDMVNGLMLNFQKLVKDLGSREAPEAQAYLRILGEELGYVRLEDLKVMGTALLRTVKSLQGLPQMIAEALTKGSKNDLFVHYIFMENTIELPTGVGLPLQLSTSGLVTPGVKAGMKLQWANQAELVAKPSVSLEFVTHLGVTVPDFAWSGVQMNSNLYHESGLEARLALTKGQLKFAIPAPKNRVKLFKASNTLHLVSTTEYSKVIPPLIENRKYWSDCRPFLRGLNYCSTLAYSNASSIEAAPYYPLTGDTRFELELEPTGDVEEYTASVNYELQGEGRDLVDQLRFAVQAEGRVPSAATMTLRYHRSRMALTSDLQVPDLAVDLGASLRIQDQSDEENMFYSLILDVQNSKVTEATFTGHVRCDRKEQGTVGVILSVPLLQAEARSETLVHRSSEKLLVQIDSSMTALGTTVSKKVAWRYDERKLEFEWNMGSNTETKKLAPTLLTQVSRYGGSLHQYSQDWLDRKVAHTDMTIRHIGSKFIAATNTWFQKASQGLPYAETLQRKLQGLQEWEMPELHVPDNLFLKSDGRIRYILNKNHVKVEIPLLFGGKSLEQLQPIRMPALDLQAIGLQWPAREFRLPPLTIPKSYSLRVPLLGVLELSTNIYSNLYNWSASYTGGNTTADAAGHVSFQSRYHMKADSALSLFSYSLQGSGETTYDHGNTFTLSCDGSLHHKFLDSNIKLSHVEKFGNNPASKGFLTFDASSDLGPQVSFSVHLDSKRKLHLSVKEIKADGQLTASSLYAKSTYALSYQRDVTTGQISGESNLRFDSSFFQATNQVMGRYGDGSLSVTSSSNLQDGTVKNTASLTYENSQLTVKSDTTGKYSDLVGAHKLDLTLARQSALLRSEHQLDFRTLKVFTLLSGSLNSRGLELNADLLGTDQSSSGAHKATLRIGQDGVLTSATTNLKILPLMFENELNAALGPLGTSLKVTTSARYQEHSAKYTLDGKVALTEVALGSVYQATVLGTDSKNLFNFRINKEGLTLSNDLMGSYKETKLEYVNSLAIAEWSLDFTSRVDNVLSQNKLYQQSFNLQLQPYSLLATLNNNLRYNALDLTNTGKLKLEPLKLNLGGNMKGTYGNEEIKHIYTLTYADLSASYKTDTVGKVRGTELTHHVSANLAGLASSIDINTAFTSESLRFNNVFHAMMEPFVLAMDAHTKGNGHLILGGKHTGQLYSKFLLKAEPLALTFSHDYKTSSDHQLLSGRSIETVLDHKISTLLTPAEQSNTWKFKVLANKNEYNHDLQTYNTKDRAGMELRAGAVADLTVLDSSIELPSLFKEPVNVIDVFDLRTIVDKPQEFSLTGSIKYDKNLDVHVINLPFSESLPAYFERIRGAILATLQNLQKYLKSINIDHYVKQYRAALDKLPQLVNDLLINFNFEGQVINAKEKLIAFMENYKITVDDLQISLDNAKIRLDEITSQLQTYLIQFDQYIKDNYDLHKLKESIIELINEKVKELKVFEENYKIRYYVMRSIQDVYGLVEKINVNKIRFMVWLQAQILEKLQQLNQQIQNIDFQYWADWLKGQVEDIDVRVCTEFLRTSLPIQELSNIVEYIKDIVMNLLEDYKVAEKINVFRAKTYELIHKYEVHKQVQVLMDKLVQLANQYKLKETTQKLTNALKKMEIKAYFEKLRTLVDKAVKKAQTAQFEQLIDEVNKFLDLLVKALRSFDYNQFVDEANKTIHELIQKINEEIRALELPQKIEATRLYVAMVGATLADYLDEIKDTQLTVITDWFWDVMSSTYVTDITERFQEILEDTRDRLYKLDIQREIHRSLQIISQVYNTLVTYIVDWWMLIAKELTDFAEQYHIRDWAESVKRLVEHGFTVPEIKTALGTLPAFEVSLRALQEATFQTPDFIVPLTDLRIPSAQINIKKLKEMKVATQFTTPEFSILNTFVVPSFTIDLIEIKLKIIRTIDQIMSSEFRWPLPEISLQDLKVKDTLLAALTLPDFHLPEVTIPEIVIPKLSLNEFQVPDIQIPEFQLPQIPDTVIVPTFGKVSAALKITSPFFTLDASGFVENTTTSERSPEILASMTAEGQSTVDLLAFTFQANAHLSAPEMERLILKESLQLSSKYLKAEHDSEMMFLGTSILGKANTLASIHTDKNTVELGNNLSLKLEKQVTFDSNTKYSHKLNLPQMDFSSQTDLHHELRVLLVLGHVAVISTGTGSWKWACPDFSDEGTHKSLLRFTVEGPVASLDMSNTINSKHIKVNQKLSSESGFLNFAKFEIQSEVQSQHVGQSVLNARGSGMLGEMKGELIGTHDARLNGRVTGTLKNSLYLVVQPFEVGAEVNNEGNMKVSFPLKLTGKIDFLNNYALVLSCHVQQVSWQSGARFNQYRYSQNFSAGNSENSLEAHVSMNGEANLDFLNIPLTIPEMTLPYTKITTRPLRDFSLWERTGLKDFLKTTKQSFDLSVNAQYKKNKDSHSILFPLGAVYDALNLKIDALHQHFEKGRDQALDFLAKSYNEAKVKFEKYNVETSLDKLPKTLRIPGYYIPMLNIKVSPFTAEMPAFGYMVPKEMSTPGFTIPGIGFSMPSYTLVLPSLEFPVLHVPTSLQKLTLPEVKILRPSDHIPIPAMGNFTYDFSFKSSVITLNTNVGLYNHSDIVAHFRSSSFSVIDALQYKLDGTTSLTRKRGLKLATALSLNNKFVEGNHDSTISLTKKNIEASVSTIAKVQCPILRVNFQQELTGNVKSKPTISSSIKLKYDFNSAQLRSSAKGNVDHKLTMESFAPYLSIEADTKGSMSGSVLSQKYSGAVSSEANSYLDTKSMRSSVKLEGTSKVDGIWNMEAKETFAGEASVGHIYAIWEHSGKNHLQLRRGFSTNGEQNSKVTLELAPWTASSVIQVHASQPSSLFKKASLDQVVTLTASLKEQRASWKGEGHIQTASLSHNLQLSNDPTEIRLDMASSLEGYMSFLKDTLLPVYDSSLWDILKLDVTTSADKKQYLHISSALVYTKSHNGKQFSIPVKETANEFIISGPELKSLITPTSSLESGYIKLAKKTSVAPFALNLPSLPQVKFPKVEVSTEYSTPEGSTLPFFEVTVPEFQITLSPFTLPKKLPFAGTILDLNEVANKIADFDLPSITMSEQNIKVPTLTFWLPAGIFLPSFGALAGDFQAASPVYNTSWNASLKWKEDHLETALEATCSSTVQLLEYDLNYGATYAFEDGVLGGKASGSFSHKELSAEYEDSFRFQGLKNLEKTTTFKVTSPTFTNVLMNYQKDRNSCSLMISSSPIGTLGLDSQKSPQVLQKKIYYLPQVSPERKLDLMEIVMSQQSPDVLQLRVNWNEEAVSELAQTLAATLHRAGETLYLYADRCHREQTGLDFSSASRKLWILLQKTADEVYNGALNQIDEVDSELRRATSKAADTFQQWEDSAQHLYQAEQANVWDLKNQAFDGALRLTQEYHKKTLLLMDSSVELLKVSQFQLPGQATGYTGDELYSMVLHQAGKALSQAYSRFHRALEALISYIKDLDENAAFPDLQKRLGELRENLEGFSEDIQHKLNLLQAAKFSDILISLQSFTDEVFQQVEKSITVLKEKTFASFKNEFLDLVGFISDLTPRVLIHLRNSLWNLHSFVLTQFQEISRKLSQLHDYVKILREEYFDPNVVGWTVKYYEIEDKLINLARKIIDALKDFQSKAFEGFLTWASKLTDEVERLTNTNVQKYLDLLRDADGKGKERLREVSMAAQERIGVWATAAKRKAAEHHELLVAHLQGASDGLSRGLQWATEKAMRLISLSVQGCHALLMYMAELLYSLQGVTTSYVQAHPGQLTISVPYPFH